MYTDIDDEDCPKFIYLYLETFGSYGTESYSFSSVVLKENHSFLWREWQSRKERKKKNIHIWALQLYVYTVLHNQIYTYRCWEIEAASSHSLTWTIFSASKSWCLINAWAAHPLLYACWIYLEEYTDGMNPWEWLGARKLMSLSVLTIPR